MAGFGTSGATAFDVSLHLDLASAGDSLLTGTITADGAVLDIAATRGAFTKSNPTPVAGKYTLAFPPDPTQPDPALYPQGHGYAVVKVDATGKVRAAGQLGDGQGFSIGGAFTNDDRWAVYTHPYGRKMNKGLLSGVIAFDDADDPAIDELRGTLRWIKPAMNGPYANGFDGVIEAEGSRYDKSRLAALAIADWHLSIGDGVLTAPFEGTVTLNQFHSFTGPDANAVALELEAASGLFSGKLRLDGKARPFKGVVLQSQRHGRGVLRLPDGAAPVTLDPSSP